MALTADRGLGVLLSSCRNALLHFFEPVQDDGDLGGADGTISFDDDEP